MADRQTLFRAINAACLFSEKVVPSFSQEFIAELAAIAESFPEMDSEGIKEFYELHR
jgi:hypothetical protein